MPDQHRSGEVTRCTSLPGHLNTNGPLRYPFARTSVLIEALSSLDKLRRTLERKVEYQKKIGGPVWNGGCTITAAALSTHSQLRFKANGVPYMLVPMTDQIGKP